MDDKLELLTKIQDRIIECRRAASEAPDSKVALFAREADLIGE